MFNHVFNESESKREKNRTKYKMVFFYYFSLCVMEQRNDVSYAFIIGFTA